ncbi:serine hydrolase domain-containing protein [Microbacterium ulmi]|uniref:Beta-lactamase family protein n=1 Tax=Microbacterium ulmi TaxID=179095 RepID=A0A7Y2M2S0_9MICO|nr:serine hydrolase domain-containing protein [Microbacterium ulmi]NII69275.1 D-alanyl-D-alanine carboxypeptidase [Microbacterium ulmi]NNH04954.1 beta-lactamase family protein [Microbacterium ulmi]
MRAKTQRSRVVAAIAGVLALVLGLASCSAAPQIDVDLPAQVDAKLPADMVAALQDAVTHAMAAAGASGAIVGVWAPWSGQWVTGLGTQRIGGGSVVTADMPFRAGPVSRAMTCDALYVLADKGVVDLDDSVADHVSGVSDVKDVTLRELCDSTSGIGSYSGQLMSSWLSVPDRVWNPRELASYGLGQARTAEPGAALRDSDAGYVLLGLALEKATGQTASELLDENVFTPLSLEHTRLPTNPAARVPHILAGHLGMPGAEGAMNCTDPLDVTAMSAGFGFTDAGVVTDIDDLGRYVQALAAQSLTPADDRYAVPLPVYAGAPTWYTTAGGVIQAGSLVGQAGTTPGYATAAFADPKSGLTVAVVLNNSASGPGIVTSLAWELASIASKAAPASGQKAPEAGLPWTAAQNHDAITGGAICPLP